MLDSVKEGLEGRKKEGNERLILLSIEDNTKEGKRERGREKGG